LEVSRNTLAVGNHRLKGSAIGLSLEAGKANDQVLNSVSGQDRDAVEGLLGMQADIIAHALAFQAERPHRRILIPESKSGPARVPSETTAAA
jgi:hypothetical protein